MNKRKIAAYVTDHLTPFTTSDSAEALRALRRREKRRALLTQRERRLLETFGATILARSRTA